MSIPNKAIFREYITVKPHNSPDFPAHVINRKISEFHFIVGFATEAYDNGKGKGNFRLHYFSPENVRELKEMCDNVKVVLSIGGRNPPFNPAEREIWPDTAIQSLKGIIDEHKFDGIDIHYEHIDSHIDINDFAHCMGRVIVGLRQQVHINVVSIAPSGRPSDRVASYYMRLYEDYNAHINWVDYQFYCRPVPNRNDFVNLYNELSHVFDASKLLVGGSTDPADAANMSREVFIEGVEDLENAPLRGAFVWNANDSAAHPQHNEQPFYVERRIQAILTGTDGQ